MGNHTLFRVCKVCNKKYFKPYSYSKNKWAKSRFCSARCRWDLMIGKPSWNKGLKMPSDYIHPMLGKHHTEEARAKIKEKRKYQVMSDKQREVLKRGQKALQEINIKKRVTKKCATCGKIIIVPPSKAYLKNCSPKCFGIYQSKHRRGKNAAAYIHGEDQLPYVGFTKKLKKQIRERDGFKCKICNKSGVYLSIHHIDYDKLNTNPNNLISLCAKCHAKTNRNRNYWTNYFVSGV